MRPLTGIALAALSLCMVELPHAWAGDIAAQRPRSFICPRAHPVGKIRIEGGELGPGLFVLRVTGVVSTAGWGISLKRFVPTGGAIRSNKDGLETFYYDVEGCPPSGFAADVVSEVSATTLISTKHEDDGVRVYVYTGGRKAGEAIFSYIPVRSAKSKPLLLDAPPYLSPYSGRSLRSVK